MENPPLPSILDPTPDERRARHGRALARAACRSCLDRPACATAALDTEPCEHFRVAPSRRRLRAAHWDRR